MSKKLSRTFSITKLLPKTGKPASTPGTVKYLGKLRVDRVKMHVIDYNESDFTEQQIEDLESSIPFKESNSVTWLNISGVHEEKIIHDIGNHYNIHPLVLEDIANTTHRPKFEEYDDYLFVVVKMAYIAKESEEVVIEQVSLILGNNYVITLQEQEDDILDGLRDRIRNNKGKVRKMGSDYLLYGIIDAIVDHYFSVLEHIGEEVEALEAKLLISADQSVLNKIYGLKQELVYLRKSIWPMREVVSSLQRAENPLIGQSTALYLRDVYDHTIQVVETVETFRDMTSGMLDLYLSTVSNKMNEVMKVLTIFAALFIPLTFVAGVYGMNFDFMPELHWEYGYAIWWGIIVVLVIGMIIYFRRKRWL